MADTIHSRMKQSTAQSHMHRTHCLWIAGQEREDRVMNVVNKICSNTAHGP
jgi:hypothetical protein